MLNYQLDIHTIQFLIVRVLVCSAFLWLLLNVALVHDDFCQSRSLARDGDSASQGVCHTSCWIFAVVSRKSKRRRGLIISLLLRSFTFSDCGLWEKLRETAESLSKHVKACVPFTENASDCLFTEIRRPLVTYF